MTVKDFFAITILRSFQTLMNDFPNTLFITKINDILAFANYVLYVSGVDSACMWFLTSCFQSIN